MEYRKYDRLIPKQLVAGGSVILAAGLLMDTRLLPSFMSKRDSGEACQQVVQAQAKVAREQLAKLLIVPEGNSKQKVREILKDPYCKLADLQIRVGATAQREAYPLEFDPQTWLVILYEGEQYAGYRINPR